MGNRKSSKEKAIKNKKKVGGKGSAVPERTSDKTLVERGVMTYEAVQKHKQKNVLGLIVCLIVVLTLSVLFMGAVSGWFDDSKVVLDEEYACEEKCEMMELTVDTYEELIKKKGSFVIFVDQDGCVTADKLRGFVQNWSNDNGVKVYRMMFSDVRDASLHNYVKYYPSVVVVSKGMPVAWLRADAGEDSDAYNFENAFVEWIRKYF